MAKENSTTGSVVGEKKVNDQKKEKKVKKVRNQSQISTGNNGHEPHPWFRGRDE